MQPEHLPTPVTASLVKEAKKRLLQMHVNSGVGHIGGNLSALDAMLVVFHEFLGSEDRFILSKGHSAGALYTALWSVGRLQDSDLATFHKDATLLAGHPPVRGIDDIVFATGSLGHGLSLAAGTALGFRLRGKNHRAYCLTSDGEWQEGSTWEALIFACHHQLANLTVLVDHNGLQGFGSTREVASMSPLWERLRGFDAEIEVIDGHNITAIRAAVVRRSSRLHIIVLKTVKGNGISFLADKMDSHYLPLTRTQYQVALSEIEAA